MTRFRLAGALWAGVVLQVLPVALELSRDIAVGATVASFVLLVAFAVANVRVVGMPVVLVGLCLNLGVIAVNGGMPVRAGAVLAVDGDPADVGGGSHHLASADDRFTALGDALPVAPLGQVVSFGDLILVAGLANVGFRLARTALARRREHRVPVERALGGLPA